MTANEIVNDGLKVKYNVFKVSDGSIVNNCFVLRPDKDSAARYALQSYAEVTDNEQLATDIYAWVGKPVISFRGIISQQKATIEQLQKELDGNYEAALKLYETFEELEKEAHKALQINKALRNELEAAKRAICHNCGYGDCLMCEWRGVCANDDKENKTND